MSTRSEMCSKSVEECAWDLVSQDDPDVRLRQRKMMVGEFGEHETSEAIEAADSLRELMGLPRQFLRLKLIKQLAEDYGNQLEESLNACTNRHRSGSSGSTA